MHQRVVAFTSVEVVHSRPATEQAVIPSPAFQRVDTFSTIQHVVTSQAPQHIVARKPYQRIGSITSHQVVAVRGTDDVLDVDQPISAQIAVVRCLADTQIDSDGAERMAVVGGVVAGPAVQRVVAGIAFEAIVACPALQ